MIASALLALALANVAQAQTASLFPVGFQGGPLAGTPIGTGAEGTTYEISGTFTELDVPFTMTLVQDATRVSEEAVISTSGVAVTINAVCNLGSSEATCVEVVAVDGSATTITESGPYDLVDVPVGTDFVSGSGSGSQSARDPSITFSASGSDDGSVIPPSISVGGSTRTTAQGATATLTDGESESTDTGISAPGTGSGAVKNAFVGLLLGVVGPAGLALCLL